MIQTAQDLPSPAKRYTERMTRAFEITNSENITLQKQIQEQDKLLHARKAREKGKRVALKEQFVFSTQKVLEIAKAAEAETIKKRSHGGTRKRTIEEIIETAEDEEPENFSSDSDSDCIVVAMRRW